MKPVITLLTDFGTKDTYVGEMKAVLLRAEPTLIDLTHDVSAFDIDSGAFHLLRAYSHFPKGTIHLAIVDPGVGTSRRAVLVETRDYVFVGPDNSLLNWAVDACERIEGVTAKCYEIRVPPGTTPTFHGRDVFAPAIVDYLAGNSASLKIAPALSGTGLPRTHCSGDNWDAEVLAVDNYGNLVTSLPLSAELLPRLASPIAAEVCTSYGTIPDGRVGLIRGSHGFWELAARERSAAEAIGAKRGTKLRFTEDG